MLHYIQGGIPQGAHREYGGARRTTPPSERMTCTVRGRITFRGRFTMWGEGGGAAFYEPSTDRMVFCRAHQIDISQLTDLALQENSCSPTGQPEVAADMQSHVGRFVAACGMSVRPAVLPLDTWVDGPYNLLLAVDAYGMGGNLLPHPVFVVATSKTFEQTVPPAAYADLIAGALQQHVGLTAQEARDYMGLSAGDAPAAASN